jgi:hypothetical protein
MAEIILITKAGGPLTKQIRLDENGELRSDGSACVMSRGTAQRRLLAGVGDLAALIGDLRSNQAIALGALRHGLPDQVNVATKRAINGHAATDLIARSADYIGHGAGQPGFALLDYDSKGMPADVGERIKNAGGFWKALKTVVPKLGDIARIRRASTSAGIYRTDTGLKLPGSNGLHIYLGIQDAADSVRFLKVLHDRCWLAGLGWLMVGAGGQLLERSIVDRMVGAGERLVFEGPPILVEPLAQSIEARRPDVRDGDLLDTREACPPLTIVEKAELSRLHGVAKHALAGEAAKARETYVKDKSEDLVARTGMTVRAARETIERQCNGILTPAVVLPFDDPELVGKTVANVLADPAAFEGETLADPLEGVDYGSTKAMIMRRSDGTPWINSFAHGRTTYELKHDAAGVRAAMDRATENEVVAALVEMILRTEVSATEEESLIAAAHKRTGIGIRPITRQIKQARKEKARAESEEARSRRMAERDDPRPMLQAPAPDAPWLPQVCTCNDVLSRSKDRIPPTRGIGTEAALACRVEIAGLYAFSRTTTSQENQL